MEGGRWKVVDGKKTVTARLVAKGYQDPDLKEDKMDIAGCVRRRSPHLRTTSLAALKYGRFAAWISKMYSFGGWVQP